MSDFMTCPRCGKQKFLLKTWKEVVETSNGGTSELIYTQYACPDKACQHIIDEELQKKHEANREREQKNNGFLANSHRNFWNQPERPR